MTLSDHRPAFLVGRIGDGAGIDDVYIRNFLEIYPCKPLFLEGAGYGGGLREIEFAPKGAKGNFFIRELHDDRFEPAKIGICLELF